MKSIIQYKSKDFDSYKTKLKTIASFSLLFSDSVSPYIHYRVTENLYTECLHAINVSRADCTADAIYGKTGVGIKTFVNTPLQKIAEFNDLRPDYISLKGIKLAKAISSYRNKRIETTMRIYGLDKMIYHYIVREPSKVKLFECEMNKINIDKIILISETNKKIVFKDDKEVYEFLFSKSTLYKKFNLNNPFEEFSVQFVSNPIDALCSYLSTLKITTNNFKIDNNNDTSNKLIIPLYVEDKFGNRIVHEKSGLNIWNASGRKRNPDEVYINFAAKIKKKNISFFPPNNTKWTLKLPNGKKLSMKLCQAGDKAIMSDPNSALGKWLLREVLNLPYKKLLTYDYLLEIGIDSVIFTKISNSEFSIDFLSIDD